MRAVSIPHREATNKEEIDAIVSMIDVSIPHREATNPHKGKKVTTSGKFQSLIGKLQTRPGNTLPPRFAEVSIPHREATNSYRFLFLFFKKGSFNPS